MYRPLDAMVIRAATTRRSDQVAWWPDLADPSDGRSDRWRNWLREVWRPPRAAALELASPALAGQVDRICSGSRVDERDVRSAVRSVMRYVLRASGRATPFGLFAGITTVRLGDGTPSVLRRSPRPTSRIDNEWLTAVITRLESCASLRPRLSVVATNLAFVRDNRLVVGCAQADTGQPGEVSVRHTTVANAILSATQTPIRLDELAARLAVEFPHASPSSIDAVLGELLARRILISNLRPPMTSTDPLGHVVAALHAIHAPAVPEAAELVRALYDLHTTIQRHNTRPENALPAAITRMATSIHATPRSTSLDLYLGGTVELPPAIAVEAAAAATTLLRLSTHPFGTPSWQDYHGRFLERYGVGAMVPLIELLYADTGLGFPAGYRASRLPAPARSDLSERDEILLALAQTTVMAGTDLVLDEALITLLARVDTDNLRAQPHTELRMRLHATTLPRLRQGEFELEVVGVARTAGATTGRFLDLLPGEDRIRMQAAYAALPTVVDTAISAQVSGPTLYPRGDNVARSPAVLASRIHLGEYHSSDEAVIDVSDLAVVGDAHRLYLWSLSRQVPVEPLVFSSVEFVNHAHPMMRFLCEISTARTAACAPFSWGAASRLPILPRVRSGRAILAAARWALAADALPNADAPRKDWADAFDHWRARFRVPRIVYLGDSDRRMRLDLDEPAHLDLVRGEVDRAGRVALREAPHDDAFGWLDGYAHEIVIPLAATTPPAARPDWPRRIVARDTAHLPAASPWLYIKLYGHPERQNAILTDHLTTLLSSCEVEQSWWFLRYADPDPHLRLRFRLRGPDEFGPTAARVARWVADLRHHGLVGRLLIDTYHPEAGRFGPGSAMAAAEAVFAADSAAAIAQLRAASRCDGPDPHALTAASMLNLAIAATGDIDSGLRWLIDRRVTSPAAHTARTIRAEAIGLANPADDWAAVRTVTDGDHITRAWQRRRAALGVYRTALADGGDPVTVLPDLLHLHSVRMAGLDPDTERLCTRLARAAALSWTTRAGGHRE